MGATAEYLMEDVEDVVRMYFTSWENGETILFPVADQSETVPLPTPLRDESHDPRRTAWYANAVAGPKDVFVVVDESGVGNGERAALLKETVAHVLSTISPNDHVWLQRRSKRGNTTSSSLLSSIGAGNKSECLGSYMRGTSALIKQLSTAFFSYQMDPALTAVGERTEHTTEQDWKRILDAAMDIINGVRALVREKSRPGVLLIISSGESLGRPAIQTALARHIQAMNLNRLPIIMLDIKNASTLDSSLVPPVGLEWSCTSMGTQASIWTSSHAAGAALYFAKLFKVPTARNMIDPLESDRMSSVQFWGGLFSHVTSTNKIFTLSRSIYKMPFVDDEGDDLTSSLDKHIDETPQLVGVVAFDFNLRQLKDMLDGVSENAGRTSFPILVTPHGDLVYHLLQSGHRTRDLFNVGAEISLYENFVQTGVKACDCQPQWMYQGASYVGCVETPDWESHPWCYVQDGDLCLDSLASFNEGETRRWLECSASGQLSFANHVRTPLLDGELGKKDLTLLRTFPAGDAATEGFEGKLIETTYFYQSIFGWDLRLALVMDKSDLKTTALLPKEDEDGAPPYLITTQIEDYQDDPGNAALAARIDGLRFLNSGNCNAPGSNEAFTNCMPDAYCARARAGKPHPAGTVEGAPECVEASMCECEPHRWSIGLTGLNAVSVHISGKSLIAPQQSFVLQEEHGFDKLELTGQMTRFLNKDAHSINPAKQMLRTEAIRDVAVSSPIIRAWVRDQQLGAHNNTVWMVFGAETGVGLIFPPSNFGFLWEPTQRPWYRRAISLGPERRAAFSTPYLDTGGAGLISTLASVVWGAASADNGQKSTERAVQGVVAYDFLYPVMNDMVSSMTNCSAKKVRDIGQDGVREVGCWLFQASGLLLTHSDFLASTLEEQSFSDRTTSEGEWPIENVFLGRKEPDLAEALIAAGLFVENSYRSPDSSETVHFYKVNRTVLSKSSVLSGTIDTVRSKCLRNPSDNGHTKWFVSSVENSNAFLLVVDGYRRNGTVCRHSVQAKATAQRDNTGILGSYCGKQQHYMSTAQSWQTMRSPCPRCEPGEYGPDESGPCLPCPVGKFSEFRGSSNCSLCATGMYNERVRQQKCLNCKRGRYSLVLGAENHTTCLSCPEGASCEQHMTSDGVRPLFGWWRCPTPMSLNFSRCKFASACLGAPNPRFADVDLAVLDHNETCAPGYAQGSTLCGKCAPNFTPDLFKLDGSCLQCPSQAQNIAVAIVGVVVGLVIVVAFIQLTLLYRGQLDESDGVRMIGLSFIQMLSLMRTYQINWPPIFVFLFELAGTSTTVGQYLVNLQCMYTSMSRADVFFRIALFWSLAPLALLIACVGTWHVIDKTVPCFEVRDLPVKIKTSCVALLYLLYPGLVYQSISLFKRCEEICGEWYFTYADIDEPCWGSRRILHNWLVGVPMLLVYVIGLPALGFWRIRKLQRQLRQANTVRKTYSSARRRRSRRQVRFRGLSILNTDHRIYGMFYSAFRPKTWWWELTYVTRKVCVTMIGIFSGGDLEVSFSLLVVVCVLLITAKVHPFGGVKAQVLYSLEMVSLMAICLTLWAGSMWNQGFEGMASTVLAVLVALVDISTVVVLVVYFVWVKLDSPGAHWWWMCWCCRNSSRDTDQADLSDERPESLSRPDPSPNELESSTEMVQVEQHGRPKDTDGLGGASLPVDHPLSGRGNAWVGNPINSQRRIYKQFHTTGTVGW